MISRRTDIDDDVSSHLQLTKCCCELKTVLVILGYVKCFGLITLALQETSHSRMHRLRQLLEALRGCAEIVSHNGRLVID